MPALRVGAGVQVPGLPAGPAAALAVPGVQQHVPRHPGVMSLFLELPVRHQVVEICPLHEFRFTLHWPFTNYVRSTVCAPCDLRVLPLRGHVLALPCVWRVVSHHWCIFRRLLLVALHTMLLDVSCCWSSGTCLVGLRAGARGGRAAVRGQARQRARQLRQHPRRSAARRVSHPEPGRVGVESCIALFVLLCCLLAYQFLICSILEALLLIDAAVCTALIRSIYRYPASRFFWPAELVVKLVSLRETLRLVENDSPKVRRLVACLAHLSFELSLVSRLDARAL